MNDFKSKLEAINKHVFDTTCQNWLFGAGISLDAKIPLMYQLTDRVIKIIEDNNNEKDKNIISKLKTELYDHSHIEHYLSHLVDLLAITERLKNSEVILSDELKNCYTSIIAANKKYCLSLSLFSYSLIPKLIANGSSMASQVWIKSCPSFPSNGCFSKQRR